MKQNSFKICMAMIAVFGLVTIFLAQNSFAQSWARKAEDTVSKLPVPRFVSLKYDEVNGRKGPDREYKPKWIYKRKGLPVMVTGEYENWRRIMDPDGSQVWVAARMLDSKRTAIVRIKENAQVGMFANPDPKSKLVATLRNGAIGDILSESGNYTRLKVGKYEGWVATAYLWGVKLKLP